MRYGDRRCGGGARCADARAGGTWIAHGSGTADRETVDANDKIRVPPSQPAYDLRRLWIPPDDFAAYYGGFANEGLWPLCHLVDVRPKFRTEDWAAYRSVNALFAAAIDREMPTPDTPVFLQDYHLAMVAPQLRRLRPNVRTALFWHIPVAESRSPADVPVAPRAARRAAGKRSARVPGGARSPQLHLCCSRTSSAPRLKPTERASGSKVRTRPWSRCRLALITIAYREW